ncbi:hypothetical protein HYR99_22250 [Candidatus Poribacteria bacterium]|nr:hypothetical protein [Candidatus Poribacteria bacterium]
MFLCALDIARRIEGRLDGVDGRLDGVEGRQERMERDLGKLKGSDRERFYRERAAAIFGRWLDKGRDATDGVARTLRAALKAGQITTAEQDAVLNADLLWLGESNERELLIVGEASWAIDGTDVRRAAERAAILRQLGFETIAFVGGVEWTGEAQTLAQELLVLSSQDGKIDRELMNHLLDIAAS